MPVSFKVDLSRVIEGLDKEKENAGKVIQRTMSDLYTRAPGWINKEIRKEYSMSGKDGTLKSSVTVTGNKLSDIKITYKSRRLTTTHFKPAKKGNRITADIKHARKVLSSRAFFMTGNNSGGNVPVMRITSNRYPIKTIRTVSVAQMVSTGSGIKANIEQVLNENLEKRFKNHCKQLLNK